MCWEERRVSDDSNDDAEDVLKEYIKAYRCLFSMKKIVVVLKEGWSCCVEEGWLFLVDVVGRERTRSRVELGSLSTF